MKDFRLPWSYVTNPEGTRFIIDDADGHACACTAGWFPLSEAHAARIITAVNEFEAMREALAVIGTFPITSPHNQDAHNMQSIARATIARAGR